jgi:hypothetical protein
MPTSLPLVFDPPRRAMPPRHLADLDEAGRASAVAELGLPAFRGKQLANQYYGRLITDPHEMTDLPAAVRDQVAEALFPRLLAVQEIADLVRTDRHNHRSVAGDSLDAEAIKVLARAHQSLIWARTRHTNMLRSALREYYPAALVAFEDLAHGDALGVLGRAPTPEQGAHLDLPAIQSALKRGGRKRNIAARAREIRAALRSEQLAAPAPVAAAFGATTRAAVGIIAELNRQIGELETSLAEHFETHPDADIYRSLPGLGVVLGARVLGEFGDDPNRYTDVKSRRNYAGTSPLTIASGKKRAVLARHVRNRRLYDAPRPLGVRRDQQQPRRASVLRPAPRRRRPPPPSPSRPG